MKKRIFALLACSAMAAAATVSFAGCGEDVITVWGPQEQQAMLQEMIDSFLEENPDFGTPIKLGVVSEADAYANLSTDVKAGADVFAFANDQLMNLKTVGALSRLPDAAVTKVQAENDEDSVKAGQVDGIQYAYPYASDNGFFLYYNKDVVSDTQAQTLEGILEACKAQKKYFIFDIDNSWYVGSFIYGAGGDYTINWNGSTVDTINCDFDQQYKDTEYSYGEVGGTALIELNENRYFVNGDDTVITSYLTGENGKTKFGACISGTWKAAEMERVLGENYGATKLPTYHSSLVDEDCQLVSFAGFKLYGVNAYSAHLVEAHQLAAYLSSEKMQEKRFDTMGTGPSNTTVAALDKIMENKALAALIEQAPHAKIQDSLPPSYWTAMEAFGTGIYGTNPTITKANLKDKVTTLTTTLKNN